MRSLFLASALLITTACVEDVGTGKTAATVADVPAETVSDAAKGVALKIDATQGKVAALGAKVSAKHPITFKDYSGTLTLDGDAVTGVAYEVQMATLEADHPRLTSHLLNEDFFEVDAYPTSTFQSSEVTTGSDAEGMTHTVAGDLTIRGTTKRVSFPARFEVSAEKATAAVEFVIDRQDFKITYPGMKDDLIQDNVVLTVELVAPRG